MLILREYLSESMIYFIIGGQMVLTAFPWMAINCTQILPQFVVLCAAMALGQVVSSNVDNSFKTCIVHKGTQYSTYASKEK